MFTGPVPPSIFQAAMKIMGPGDRKSLFHKGDLVEGKVLQVISKNQALVRLSGIEMVALTQSRMTPGQNIVGKIETVTPNITISLLQADSAKELKTAALMRLLLPAKAPMGEVLSTVAEAAQQPGLPPKVEQALKNLSAALAKAAVADLGEITPDKLRETIKRSGLFLESTLKEAAQGKASPQSIRAAVELDVKTMIGRTLATVEERMARLVKQGDGKALPHSGNAEAEVALQETRIPADRKGAAANLPDVVRHTGVLPPQDTASNTRQASDPAFAELIKLNDTAKRLRDAINNIELNQLLNATAKEKGGAAQSLYQLPFISGMNLETARVYIRPRTGEQAQERPRGEDKSTVVFMLNMSKLGPVRVDVNVSSGKVAGSVYVIDDAVAGYVSGRAPELVKSLEAAGYTARFEVVPSDMKHITQEMENYAQVSTRGIVDMRA